jgi:hypothetical protein
MQFEFSRQIFIKSSKISNITKICWVGGRVLPWTDGRIERRDVSNSRFIRNVAKDPQGLSFPQRLSSFSWKLFTDLYGFVCIWSSCVACPDIMQVISFFFFSGGGVAQHTKSGLDRCMAIYLPLFFNSLFNKSITVSVVGGAISA